MIRANLVTGGSVERSAAIVASWARYAESFDEQGRPIDVQDALRDELMPRARQQRLDPLSFVRYQPLFDDLADNPRFAAAYKQALASLHEVGARKSFEALNARLRLASPTS